MSVVSKLPSRTALLAIAATAVAGSLVYYVWWRPSSREKRKANRTDDGTGKDDPKRRTVGQEPPQQDVAQTPQQQRTMMMAAAAKRTPRTSKRSLSLPPHEEDVLYAKDALSECVRHADRACAGLRLGARRNERDAARLESLRALVEKARQLDAELSSLVHASLAAERLPPGGRVSALLDEAGVGGGHLPPSSTSHRQRASTLSVLSDDSFRSAVEEFETTMMDEDEEEDNEMDAANIVPLEQLVFYQEGIKAARAGEVHYRKMRVEYADDETDFAAKIYCLRRAYSIALTDEHRTKRVANSARAALGALLRHSKQSTASFYSAFDALIIYVTDRSKHADIEHELSARAVADIGFWDVVLDFVLLDSIDELRSPPSAVYSVTKNRFLSEQMKYSTISTIIWSMLKTKRARLQYPSGFMAHFYDVSECISPAITLGLLGTNQRIGELCQYFKEQIVLYVQDVFSTRRVRYSSPEELAEDVWILLERRLELLQTRLTNELLEEQT